MMHANKGSREILGFESISVFTYEAATEFDLVQSDSIPIIKELVDLTLAARARTRLFLKSSKFYQKANEYKSHKNTASLKKPILSPPESVSGNGLADSAFVASSKPNCAATKAYPLPAQKGANRQNRIIYIVLAHHWKITMTAIQKIH